MTNPAPTLQSYFNLHTNGIGYLQRCREVQVDQGGRNAQKYIACTIAALVGPRGQAVTRFIELNVPSKEAEVFVRRYIGKDDPKHWPLVRFRAGDLYVDPFIRPDGKDKGKAAASLKARLLKVSLMNEADLAKIEHHELTTHGIGYLSRPQEVSPNDGEPFLACTIGALCGATERPQYTYFKTAVTNAETRYLIRDRVDDVDAKRKVFMAFTLDDLQTDPYMRTKGEKAGTPGASLWSNLVDVSFIKVDGQQVYPTPSQASDPAAESASQASPDARPASGSGETSSADLAQLQSEKRARLASFLKDSIPL